MTFVSYAQNFEDVMLWRALGHEPDGSRRRRPGTWIDVGAWDPMADSVTHAFHLRGWRGINLEPNPDYFPRLAAARPGDINLQAAAGDSDGTLLFWRIAETGLSTGDPATAEQHRREGRILEPLEVPVRRLAAICDEHGIAEIDFLKIDCEGMERAVLAGADLHRLRPRLILLEATKPNSQEPTHGEWSDLLDQAGYCEVYFDGLNRFYAAEEHRAALAPDLAAPPNVFDQFVRADDEPRRIAREAELRATRTEADAARRLLAADREVSRAERRTAQARDTVTLAMRERDEARQRAEREIAAEQAQIAHLKDLLARTYASTSWQVSRPVRVLARTIQRLRHRPVAAVDALPDLTPIVSATVPEPVAQVLGQDHLGGRERAALRRLRREAP